MSCKNKERELVNIPNISTTEIQELQSKSFYDAPIVMRQGQLLISHQLKRNADLSLRASSDTLLSPEPAISIFLNNQYEFDVNIRTSNAIAPSTFNEYDTILVTSDLEGNYQAFVSLLQGNHVIDQNKNWIYGDNHLVMVGDMVDRGKEVLQILWLIYKLEDEAAQAGGHVHYLLGNHEQMNIWSEHDASNIAYVHPDYLRYAGILEIPYPDWFDDESILGSWLLQKNSLLNIDSILFVHGGISKNTAKLKMSHEDMNERIRTSLRQDPKELHRIEANLHSADGPLWYRGIADQKMTQKGLNNILDIMEAQLMVIGHTIVDEYSITPLYKDRVLPIDLHHSKTFKNGTISGLFIDTNGCYEVDNRGKSKLLFLHSPVEI